MNKFEGSIVIYKSGNFIQKRMAYRIACAIKAATGVDVTFGKVQTARKPVRLVTKDDKSLKNGDWKISIVGRTATFAAGSYYGYGGIAQFLATDAAKDFYAFEDGYVKTGNFLDMLDPASFGASSRYAYDKRGEVRVMFNNVLFGDRTGTRKDENGKAIKDVPADKRNELQYEMFKQYMPDVLGCQEFNITKRGERDLPHSDLVALLKSLGYKESCPRDVKVHPFFNNTPIFYNTKTTKLIKSEYYWYKVHVDKENETNCSPMDCASKALTWGVFEDKATGKRYIVVSTHMATRSNGVRGVQAVEAVDVISSLVEKYNAPVFFGGDFNGLCQHANYIYFTGENANYEDLALSGAPTEYCSELATHHTYPYFDNDLGFMIPDPSDSTHFAKNCIDHIMLTNGENVKTSVYGVVADECSMSASDHYPIFVDVTL
ncbi:MAG: hypothetical protein IJW16_06475 [Clostridia bacterium]|nr:hypothetical protein [Clostridia bacterium]